VTQCSRVKPKRCPSEVQFSNIGGPTHVPVYQVFTGKRHGRVFYVILRGVPGNAPYSVVHCLILEKNGSRCALSQSRNDVSCDVTRYLYGHLFEMTAGCEC
jgi:hypothetical protein